MREKVKYNKNEKRFVVSCLLLIFLLIIILIIDFNLGTVKGKQDVIGKTQYTFNNVKRKYIDQIIWEDVDRGSAILDKDSINTGPNSSVKIKLLDGTLLEIGENSLVLLEITEDDVTLNLTRGYLRTKRDKKQLKKDNKITLVSKNKEIELKEGEIKLSKKEDDKDIEVFVEKGEVDISIDGKKEKISQGEKATLKERAATIEKAVIKLINPEDSKNYFISKASADILFKWNLILETTSEKKYSYLLEISDTRNFDKVITKIDLNKLETSSQLPKGNFFWRVSSIDIDTNQKSTSEVRKISIIYNKPIKLLNPKSNTEFVYLTEKPTISFFWEEHEYAASYELEISDDRSFKNIIKKMESQSVRFSYQWEADMPVGESKVYYWRIKSSGELNEWPGQTSSTSSFKLSKKDKLAEPNLLFPEDNHTMIYRVALKDLVIFKWSQSKEDLTSILQFSKSYNFQTIYQQFSTNDNYWVMKNPFPIGTYYWRVQQKDVNGFSSEFSKSSSFQIIKLNNIALVHPLNNSTHEIYNIEEDGINFKWKKSNVAGRYLIEISDRADFKTEIISDTITTPYKKIYNLKPGKVYWRVSLLDDDKKPLITSLPKFIIINNELPDPDPQYPINYETIEMLEKDDLTFIWNRTKGANLYQIKLYQLSDTKDRKKDILIFDLKTKNLTNSFSELEKLDIGNFYWTILALKIGKNGTTIRQSNEIRHSFSIDISELTSNRPEINILTPEVQVIEDKKKKEEKEEKEVKEVKKKDEEESNEENLDKKTKDTIDEGVPGEQ